MPPDKTIHVFTEDRIARVTLDRPPLNVLDIEMMRELSAAVAGLSGKTDFMVFEGAGAKGFSAGAEVLDHTPDRVAEMLGVFHGIFLELRRADCIALAAVHGHCLGGGCELATFCDFVVAAESARFGLPEIKLGCFPPLAMVTFPPLVGPRAALDLILSGRTISAPEALQLGLITRVVPDDELRPEVDRLLEEFCALSPAVLRIGHRALRRAVGQDFEARLHEVEDLYLNELMKTEDAAEGIRAFLEKRAPLWRGC